jgi:hypothetical protein
MSHKYQLQVAASPWRLSVAINACLADGWELWGNPFALVYPSSETITYCQAVVKIGEEKDWREETRKQSRPAAGYTVGTPEMPTPLPSASPHFEKHEIGGSKQLPTAKDWTELFKAIIGIAIRD